MDIVRYILLAQVFLAFFVAGGVFFKNKSLRNTTLALLIALVGFHIFLFLYGSGQIGALYPAFRSWFYYEVAFLFGPLVFIHMQSVMHNEKKLVLLDLLHLLPVFIFWIGYGDVLFINSEVRGQYIRDNFLNRTMIWNYFLAVQMLFYAILSISLLYSKRSILTLEKFQYLLFLVLAYLSSTVFISYLTHYAEGWRDFASYYLILTILIFGIGYVLFRKPDFLKQIKKKYFSSNLGMTDMLRIKSKIENAFEVDKLFLKGDLSISKLGLLLEEKPNYVSQTFSECIKENFNIYVNRHRIDVAKKLLHSPDYEHFKIEAIAEECGFNNKVTFYKAFTKFTNVTPSKYRKNRV